MWKDSLTRFSLAWRVGLIGFRISNQQAGEIGPQNCFLERWRPPCAVGERAVLYGDIGAAFDVLCIVFGNRQPKFPFFANERIDDDG